MEMFMLNKELYYEVKASTSNEVEAAYKYAKENGYKYYRVVSNSGKLFGWVDGKHVAAKDKQEWFEIDEPDKLMVPDEPVHIPYTEQNNDISYAKLYYELQNKYDNLLIKYNDLNNKICALRKAAAIIWENSEL